jgi:hypothetical protein
MPQQSFTVVENSFVNGLVTEATGLNFPDKACSDTYDCIFDIDGSVYRRTGFDFETNFTTKLIDRDNFAMKTYLWQDVAGDGNVTVVVVQVGPKLYFYETLGTGIFSTGAQTTTVILSAVAGAPVPDSIECQFCDGNGFLIVTHPYCEPMRITYDVGAHTATATNIIIMVRDFAGDVNDPLAVDTRPTSTLAALNVHHHYNLLNQGWTDTNLTAWDTAQTTMPSNADVMWQFVDTTNTFTATTAIINSVFAGNSPAPNGHYIMTLSNLDRNAASGLTGLPVDTTSFQRPTCCSFFAGRVFYAGINAAGYNTNIYFTQILEGVNEYGFCYQVNDPTAQDLFNLLPSDGGVLSIPEAGTVYKMQTIPGGLCIFAANGVWFLTGSTGLGFTANDYVLLKIADIGTISDTSFVNVNGYPAWWNSEGIYVMVSGQANTVPTVQSLTYNTFKTFYDGIPVPSKRFARGFFDKTDQHIRWIFRSADTTTVNETYEYDQVLNYNMRTQAFYPWTISSSPVKIHSILSSEIVTRPIQVNNVIDSVSNNVVDSGGNQVISFSLSGNDSQQIDKYLVSYPDNSGSYNFTFANRTDDTFIDWKSYDATGVNYDSYLITGFKLRGQGIRKYQSNWVDIYSRLDEPMVTYKFQAIWDFANTPSGTGRWSTNQLVTHSDASYNNAVRRLKVRGHGKAMQFRVSSVQDNPFDIIGWTSLQTVNGAP